MNWPENQRTYFRCPAVKYFKNGKREVEHRKEKLVLINWVNAETYLFCFRQDVMLQDTWTASINHIILLANVAVLYQLWHSDGPDEIRLPWCMHNLHSEAVTFALHHVFMMCNTSDVALSGRLLTFRRTISDCFYFIYGNLITISLAFYQ